MKWRRRVDDEPLSACSHVTAALLLAREVSRPGAFGLTLDLGHLLAAGEHPAHSVALAGAAGMLFGLHVSGSLRHGVGWPVCCSEWNALLRMVVHATCSCLSHQTVPRLNPCPVLPCPALPCPALPCPALPCQLNDAHVKLGGEDGLAFSSVHPTAALELVRWLQRVNYDGSIYFDTFPSKEDPVREAAYNIRRFRALWARAATLAANGGLDGFAATHDAMGALELLEAWEERQWGGAQGQPGPAAAEWRQRVAGGAAGAVTAGDSGSGGDA